MSNERPGWANDPDSNDLPKFPLGRSELIAAAFLFLGIAAIVAAVVLTQDNERDAGPVVSVTATPTLAPLPSASGVQLQPTDADSEAIIALARKSIEVLPQGQWPSLYTDFVAAFAQRCSLEEFTQVGIDSAAAQGEDLQLLGFKFIQDVTITGDTATGTIVGEVRGKTEYQVEAAFAKENGVWKITPVSNTEGCSAFSVFS